MERKLTAVLSADVKGYSWTRLPENLVQTKKGRRRKRKEEAL